MKRHEDLSHEDLSHNSIPNDYYFLTAGRVRLWIKFNALCITSVGCRRYPPPGEKYRSRPGMGDEDSQVSSPPFQ